MFEITKQIPIQSQIMLLAQLILPSEGLLFSSLIDNQNLKSTIKLVYYPVGKGTGLTNFILPIWQLAGTDMTVCWRDL